MPLYRGGATDKLPDNIKLKPNDKIVAVAQREGEPLDIIDMDLRDVVKKIRGKKGTEVRLTILRETTGHNRPLRMIVPIVREVIKLQDSDAESDIYTLKRGNKKMKLGYIKLPSFYIDQETGKSSAGDTRKHLNDLMGKGVKGIVLDLRNNPGGSLHEAVKIVGLFIDSGPVIQIKQSGGRAPYIMRDNDIGTFYDGPLVILVDRFSASASEILAGAIKDYRRGLIVGPTKTFGKGTVQSYHELAARRGAVKITTGIFYQPSGTSNQLNGISPDVIIPAISSIWNIGEHRQRYPLKWKRLKSAYFKAYKYVNGSLVGSLKRTSSKRIAESPEFKKLIAKINKLKKQVNNKTISLKEETSLDKERKKELEKTRKKINRDKIIDVENDMFLQEAFNVTYDYIRLLKK